MSDRKFLLTNKANKQNGSKYDKYVWFQKFLKETKQVLEISFQFPSNQTRVINMYGKKQN